MPAVEFKVIAYTVANNCSTGVPMIYDQDCSLDMHGHSQGH